MNDKISRRLFAVSAAASGAAFFGFTRRVLADAPASTTTFAKIDEPDLYAYTMSGTERHFGRYSAFGEMNVSEGDGVVVLTSADGGQIVGVVEAAVEEDDRSKGHMHLSWRDSVSFSDGTNYVNTGRFASHRPDGLVVVATIAELVRLLLPTEPPPKK